MSYTQTRMGVTSSGTRPWRITGVLLLAALHGCIAIRHAAAHRNVWRSAEPPPPAWEAAVSFLLADSTQVEFFDGERTRVVHARDGLAERFGASAFYRVRPRPTFSTTIHVTAHFPGHGTVTAEYPLIVEPGAYYTVSAYPSSRNPQQQIIPARDARSYPMPPGARREPSDSLWVYWTARTRECWTCPS
jgi:hypothetical protein